MCLSDFDHGASLGQSQLSQLKWSLESFSEYIYIYYDFVVFISITEEEETQTSC